MFLMERQLYMGQLAQDPTELEEAHQNWRKQRQLHEQGEPSEIDNYNAITESASDTPDLGSNCYAINGTFIDVRTPFDEMRGGITLAALCFLAAPLGVGVPFVLFDLLPSVVSGTNTSSGNPLGVDGYVVAILISILNTAVVFAAFYFGWRYLRLESFVQRRLLVRFNRQTRKVYVHRPAYAGGVIELPWADCLGAASSPKKPKDEASGLGAPLGLYWPHDRSPTGRDEIVLVGRRARSTSELVNFWEFIRRYMEEGPQVVPRPRLIGKFPWPWVPLQAGASLVWPLWQMRSLNWMAPLLLLISPAILLFAAGQWLSLLTCWEPVFPRAIRQASGEGFMSVVRARLIDLGAWAMLAGVVAGVVTLVSGA